jgi:hypothetical protein
VVGSSDVGFYWRGFSGSEMVRWRWLSADAWTGYVLVRYVMARLTGYVSTGAGVERRERFDCFVARWRELIVRL